MDQNVGF